MSVEGSMKKLNSLIAQFEKLDELEKQSKLALILWGGIEFNRKSQFFAQENDRKKSWVHNLFTWNGYE